MKLSTRARYGTKAMLDLAINYGGRPVLLKSVADRQGIPGSYLENIMTSLVASGLVQSTRGKRGGFMLAKRPAEIRLSQIVQTVEGSLTLANCVENSAACRSTRSCVVREVWHGLRGAMFSYLDDITLAELASRQMKLDTGKRSKIAGGKSTGVS